jgi:hypothetical protein
MAQGVRHSPRKHPVGGLVQDHPTRTPRRARWVLLLLVLAAVLAGLRGVHALADEPDESAIFTEQVVVVGVTGRDQLNETDKTVLGSHLADAQAGVLSIRPRYVGDCAAAGWTTLGSGRRAAVGGLCHPEVQGTAVTDWAARRTAAAARQGDAQLGTLASSVRGCVAAVGPGAALAAARPDGTLARYETAQAFLDGGLKTTCPITLVDAGVLSDHVITRLAADTQRTLIVAGVGPADGSHDPSLQVVYRLGTTLPGWPTSASTRRQGIITLTDLTRTLIAFGAPGAAAPTTVDGSPLEVDDAALSVNGIERHISAVAALSDAAPVGYVILGLVGSALFLAAVGAGLAGRLAVSRVVMTLGTILLAAMMLTGAVPWQRSNSPGVFLGVLVLVWGAMLTALALLLGRLLKIPAGVAGAALSVTAFTVDAALGGPMQAGSMINSRPIFGLRWYGFGNVTFGAYASSALVLAGYLASRLGRRAGLVAVGAIGFGVVICEGWPSTGTDFGGVIALTPAVLWLLLSLSGVRVTVPKLLLIGAAAVLAVAAISLADWSRGADKRSHLGNFVQRVIDGDASDVVSRKAVAAAETIVSPLGIGCVIIGITLWVVIFRWLLPAVSIDFPTLRAVLLAAMITAIVGTALNDGGISVWLTVTAAMTTTMVWLWLDRAVREGWTLKAWRAARR